MTYQHDGELLQRWRDGDRSAGDELARKHYNSVHRFFEVKASAHAEDLVQRTFLACVQSVDRLERAASFRSFLFGIARNVLLQHLARRRPDDASDFEEVPGRRTRVSALVARRLEHQLVLRALAEIPEPMTNILQLYYWEGMAVREIADAASLTPTTVSSQLFRARNRLREVAVSFARQSQTRARLEADLDGITRAIAGAAGGPSAESDEA